MKFYSTNRKAPTTDVRTAVMQGLAPDGGLYMPTFIPELPAGLHSDFSQMRFHELAYECARPFFDGAIPPVALRNICREAFDFPIPVVPLEDVLRVMELYHGPTLAFKDFAARFMARLMAFFIRGEDRKVTVLVATSGDTGSAVGHGFRGVEGIDVVILYPKGQVSHIQEMQLTTIGGNVAALEVEGTFDDCQRLVKEAFVDRELQQRKPLASANSINIARLIPQSFYYHYLAAQFVSDDRPLLVSVPSGNFGNLTAGLIARRMGARIDRFVAALNRNDTVMRYLQSGVYKPQPSVRTISNAMDVGDPSNFARMAELFQNDVSSFRRVMSASSFSDEKTKEAIRSVYDGYGYVLDPHGAVGWLGLEKVRKQFADHVGIAVETAHPAKFRDVVEDAIGESVEIPQRLATCLEGEKEAVAIGQGFDELKQYLLSS